MAYINKWLFFKIQLGSSTDFISFCLSVPLKHVHRESGNCGPYLEPGGNKPEAHFTIPGFMFKGVICLHSAVSHSLKLTQIARQRSSKYISYILYIYIYTLYMRNIRQVL